MAHGFQNPEQEPRAAFTPGPPLPVKVEVVGDVQLSNGAVTLAPGSSISVNNPVTQVGLNVGANHIGNVSVDNLSFDDDGFLNVNVQVGGESGGFANVGLLAGTAHIGSVSIDNNVTVNATLTGTSNVSVTNIPHVVVDSGSSLTGIFSINNFPTTTNVALTSNSITVSNFPATQPVSIASNVTVNPHNVTLTSNSVIVSSITGNVTVSPHQVSLTSNSVTVSNFPATQPVSGTVTATLSNNHVVVDSIIANVNVNPHSVSITGTVPVFGTVTANLGSNSVTVSNQPSSIAVQGVDQSAASHTIATDTSGSIVPPTTVVSQKVVSVSATTSTTLLASNTNRLLFTIQLNDTNNILISEVGNALTNIGNAGTMIYGGSTAGTLYTPPFVTNSAITAYCANATTVRVTEYSKR